MLIKSQNDNNNKYKKYKKKTPYLHGAFVSIHTVCKSKNCLACVAGGIVMSGVVSWQQSPANPVQLRAATPAINLTCSQSSRGPTGKTMQHSPANPASCSSSSEAEGLAVWVLAAIKKCI